MQTRPTLLLSRSDVEQLLGLAECIEAVEEIFRRQGEGKLPPAGIHGIKTRDGGLHVKTAVIMADRNYLVTKLNTNFPLNPQRFGLPTIQGVILLCDADSGRALALLDSIDITMKRTAAATAVAAKYLARKNSSVATVCGCGEQGREQLRALSLVLPLTKVCAFDMDDRASTSLATELSRELQIDVTSARHLSSAISKSDVIVTCTTATEFLIRREDVVPGTFVAAVGADDVHKQEIEPELIASAKVVGDSVEQICSIGDTHHAIAGQLMRKEDVYAELGEIVAAKKPGRESDEEIIIFDSTGVAIEDAAAVAVVYQKACRSAVGNLFEFAA